MVRDQVKAVTRTTLDRLQELAGNIPVALYLLKPMERLGDPDHARAFREYLRGEAEQRGFQVLDAYRADYSGYTQRDLLAYPGDSHPNALAHRLVADFLLAELLDRRPWSGAPEVAQVGALR